MNNADGEITKLIHALNYLAQQYRAAKRDGDEVRASAVKAANRIIVDVKEQLYNEGEHCAPVGVRL